MNSTLFLDGAAQDVVDTATSTVKESTPLWLWVVLMLITGASFWSQATVTEERFVPALNVVANYFNIPDDVAGATIMAAGASSPELFSSLVSLFITHSALGLGTIVGSEIFNQLIICAGAVLSARSGQLKLDKAILIREVGFYTLSIILLLVAISDRRPLDADSSGPNYIFVSLWKANALFGGYILYVFVCSYYDKILSLFHGEKGLTEEGKISYGSTSPSLESLQYSRSDINSIKLEDRAKFFTLTKHEPEENFKIHSSYKHQFQDVEDSNVFGSFLSTESRGSHPLIESFRGIFGHFSSRMSSGLYSVKTEKPSNLRDLYDMEFDESKETFSCFLWQRSIFYNKAKVSTNAWHLRWFEFTRDEVKSFPDRASYEKHMLTYPRFEAIDVDSQRLIIKLNCLQSKRKQYYLMAPNSGIFDEVVNKCENTMRVWHDEVDEGDLNGLNGQGIENDIDSSHADADAEPSLIEFPYGESLSAVIFFFILYPLKFLMHISIPDVRHLSPKGDPTSSVWTAFVSIFSCLIWLIIGSYAMVASLESLAEKLNIPDAIIGATVSAAGTSLPNYVASQVAARQGFGNMAVGNAFGSNTFNLTVGLGLPWVLYIAFANGGESYHGLRDDGITSSVIILALVLLIFIVLIGSSNFVLYTWHGHVFFVLYTLYLLQVIAQVYIGKLEN